MTPVARVLAWLLASLLCVPAAPAAEQPVRLSPSEAQELFDSANAAYARAVTLLATRPATAPSAFNTAAETYERLIDAAPAGDAALAALYHNLGNARLLGDNPAAAVLAYRRGLALAPTDARTAANLQAARRRVRGVTDAASANTPLPEDESNFGTTLLRLGRAVPPDPLLGTAVTALAAGWLLALWRLMAREKNTRPSGPLVAAAFVLGTGAVGMLLLRSVAAPADDAVLMRQSIPRTGPDDLTYAPAADFPLPAGAEVRILERQTVAAAPSWSRVRVLGRETGDVWLPTAALEPVIPSRDR